MNRTGNINGVAWERLRGMGGDAVSLYAGDGSLGVIIAAEKIPAVIDALRAATGKPERRVVGWRVRAEWRDGAEWRTCNAYLRTRDDALRDAADMRRKSTVYRNVRVMRVTRPVRKAGAS